MGALLEVEAVAKNFGGLRAVDGASFTAEARQITGLIGPNGAGKTTLFNLISGFLRPDSGTVRFRDHDIHRLPPHAIANGGIARTFQDPRIYPQMTVLENVMVGIRQRGESPPWALLRGRTVDAEWRAVRERSQGMLETVGLAERASDLARHLSFGEQRFLSIARSLVANPYLIMMDEPTVGLDGSALTKLLNLLNVLVTRDQKAVLIIEHNMDAVMTVSAKVVLMVQGCVVVSGTPDEIRQDRTMMDAYLGTRHAARSL